MFAEILDELVRSCGADLAVFCDYDGEAIAHASSGPDDFEVRVTGAQLAALVFEAQRIARESNQGDRVAISCIAENRSLLVEALPGNYYVVLGLPPRALEPAARRRLRAVADRFLTEL